jgi:hypothetical protein
MEFGSNSHHLPPQKTLIVSTSPCSKPNAISLQFWRVPISGDVRLLHLGVLTSFRHLKVRVSEVLGVPQDPWASILEKDLILDDLGVPTFLETSLNRD